MNTSEYKKQIVIENVKKGIETKNWHQLSGIMPVADKYNISKILRLKGWKLLASHYKDTRKYIDAIVAFNKARQIKLIDNEAIQGLFNSLTVIYDEYQNDFSREDLVLLDNQVGRLISFYTIHLPVERSIVDDGIKLLSRIQSHLHSAPSKIETPATHKIEYIFNALYSDMTTTEIQAEFARIMAPYFRERMEKEESGDEEKPKKKKKKKRGSKK